MECLKTEDGLAVMKVKRVEKITLEVLKEGIEKSEKE